MADWLANWNYRYKITIDDTNVDSNLTNFPVLLYLSTSSGQGADDVSAIFDELAADANRFKIAVTTSDGTTQCYVEIEKWDDASEEAWLWVKVPDIQSSGGAVIYLYYDSNKADNTDYIGDTGDTPAQSVWDSNFKAVYHLGQDPTGGSGCILDSTANGHDMTPAGTMTAGDLVSSQIADGLDFDGSDDRLTAPDSTDFDFSAEFTLSTICNPDGTDAKYRMIYRYDASSQDGFMLGTSDTDSGYWLFNVYVGGTSDSCQSDSAPSGNAQHIGGIRTAAGAMTLYVNGTAQADTGSKAGAIDSNSQLWIGSDIVPTNFFDGIITEARISDSDRGAAWMKAEYYTGFDDFVTFEADATWLEGWQNRIELTIDDTNVDNDLTNYPVMIYLSASSGQGSDDVSFVFDHLTADANRKKIAVTTDDGVTECYVEIEKWDDGNEKAWLWVKVPSILASGGATLYLYYDILHADNDSYVGDTGDAVAQNVWDSDFKIVCHMADSNCYDSTSNGYDGSQTGTADITGQIGQARDFERGDTADNIDFGDVADVTGSFTASIIYKFESTGTSAELLVNKMYQGVGLGATIGWCIGLDSAIPTYWKRCYISLDDGNYIDLGQTMADGVDTTTFHEITMSFDTVTGTGKLFIDGALIDSEVDSNMIGADLTNSVELTVGCSQNSTPAKIQWMDGILDEFQFSHSLRSVDWIKANYYNHFDDFITFSTTEETASWLSSWAKRIKVTLAPDNVDATLTNFPTLLYLSASSGTGNDDITAIFDELGANSLKLAVTGADGITQQYVEVEKWDNSGEEAWLWTKVPSLDDTDDTVLYLYYDSARDNNTDYVGTPGGTPAQSVWDSSFKAVYHLSEDPNGDGADAIKDSTSNNNDGTPVGTMTTADLVSTMLGDGIDFDGSDDGISIATDATIQFTTDFTMEVIFRADPDTNHRQLISKWESTNAEGWAIRIRNNDCVEVAYKKDASNYFNAYYNSALSSATYYYAACYYAGDAGDPDLYLNGASVALTNVNDVGDALSGIVDSGEAMTIGYGRQVSTSIWYHNDYITEVRISSGERTADWIKATYYSAWDNLAAFGAEVSLASSVTYTVALTEVLPCTLAFDTGLGLGPSIALSTPLSCTAELIAANVRFFIGLAATPLNFTFSLVSGLAVKLIGRDLWSFNSFITKNYDRDSTITKTLSRQSRITKNFDEDSSVR